MTGGDADSRRSVAVIDRQACIGCEQCVAVCPVYAITMDADAVAVVDAGGCTGCGLCVPACPTSAIAMSAGAEPAPAPVEPAAARGSRQAEVWVVVEQTEGRPAPVSWELLGKARELAGALGGWACAVVLGHGVAPLARLCGAYGADRVYLVDDPALAHYQTRAYLEAVARLARQYRPEIVLLGATTTGRDLAGAVATSLRTGLTADCTGLAIDAQTGLLEQTRPAYGGNIMATILCESRRPQMATVRPRVMPLPARDDSRSAEVIAEPLGLQEENLLVRVIEHLRGDETQMVRIEDAGILVSGGRGLGGPDGFRLLADLAEALGGVVSGSRAAVDHGWIEHSRQVGQTGKTVRPRLYVACGISGAIQHRVGMETSDVIVAVNRDPNAPIFDIATYGIVGDLFEVVPALARAARARLPRRGAAHG